MAHIRHLVLLFTRAALCGRRNSNLGLALVGLCLVGFIVGSPLYHWHSKDSSAQASCTSCVCGCPLETLLPIQLGFMNSSLFADCGKHDPEIHEEMEKDAVTLLAEELDLMKMVDNDNLQRTKTLITDIGQVSIAYKNEHEKCNIKTKISEEAREKAEAELVEELKLSALWEDRARQLGWMDKEIVIRRV